MSRGWIALHRKIQDNFLWKEPRKFSKAEAWIDILMEVQHSEKPQEVAFGMTVLTCNYGESLKAISTWAKRWRWSRNKVYRFFELLGKCGMIVTKSEQVTTRLTVCNYRIYDPKQNRSGTPDRTQIERRQNADRTQTDTDKNDNNVKNGKKTYMEFVKLTDAEHQKLVEKFGKEGTQQRIENLNNYIGSKGKKYKSHYHTILNWERKNNGSSKTQRTISESYIR